jgi:hypothetical protein
MHNIMLKQYSIYFISRIGTYYSAVIQNIFDWHIVKYTVIS